MAIVFSDNILELAFEHTYGGRPAVNVWHIGYDLSWSGADLVDIVDDARNNWQDHILDMLVADVIFTGVTWRNLDPGASQVGFVSPDSGRQTTGALGVSGAPPNVALLVHKHTDDRPRGRRDGRSFLVGVTDADITAAGILGAPYKAVLDAALVQFYDGISDLSLAAARWPAVLETTVASRTKGPQQVTIGSRRVTSLSLDSKVATQRDRLR